MFLPFLTLPIIAVALIIYRRSARRSSEITLGHMVSDWVAAGVGSWTFLIGQSVIMAIWIIWNSVGPVEFRFDREPFIMLNLVLSFEAAFTAPVLLMSANRQSEIDRATLNEDRDLDRDSIVRLRRVELKNDEILERTEAMHAMLRDLMDGDFSA